VCVPGVVSGYFTITGLMNALRNSSQLIKTSSVQIARFRVGSSGKKSTVKFIGCQIGVSYLKREFAKDTVHGHHTIPKNLGGNSDQALLFLPAETHHMFHWVLHVMLKNDPELRGMGNWTSKKNWDDISQSRAGRKLLYNNILAASKIVDKFCKLRKPKNLQYFVQKNRKGFIGD